MTKTVLVVDDSPTARLALRRALVGAGLEIVGEAATGAEAEASVADLSPDIITMDLFLGSDDGVEVTAAIMEKQPTPILLVTSADTSDAELCFRVVAAGALDVFPKLPGAGSPAYERQRQQLIRRLKALSEVPVITRRRRRQRSPSRGVKPVPAAGQVPMELVVIGASTGGPPLLEILLSKIPPPYPLPIVLVQHVAEGFAGALAEWLGKSTGHRVTVGDHSLRLEPGLVVVAPDDRHLALTRGMRTRPTDIEVAGHHRPSIDYFFETVTRFQAASTVGILLTGMGKDGARGMAGLRRAGAITLVQDPETALLPSMPRAAIAQEAPSFVANPDAIASYLIDLGAARTP